MKINMQKNHGGVLCPANDRDLERMNGFKNGEIYEVEIKKSRNPAFHRKVFAFFNFCFEFWSDETSFQCEAGQFDLFRRNLTVLAGFKEIYYTIDGRARVEAKSLAFANMEQEEFERCYSALINAAMKHIFRNTDEATYNRLASFF